MIIIVVINIDLDFYHDINSGNFHDIDVWPVNATLSREGNILLTSILPARIS
jgi:hypothetical protein